VGICMMRVGRRCRHIVGDPLEAGGLEYAWGIRLGFQAADDGDGVRVVFRIDVFDIVHPVEVLCGLVLICRPKAEVVFGEGIEKAVELVLDEG
jgi:hypothetical protein